VIEMSVPQFRRVLLPDNIPGILYLHSTPGRYESWLEFEAALKTQPVDVIVALTPLEELRANSTQYAAILDSRNHTWSWLNYPIPDFGVPEDREGFIHTVRQAANHIRSGKTVLVHCGAGIGRTGMFAVGLLLDLGISLAEALELVKKADAHPERTEQKEFIKWFSQSRHMSNDHQ